MKLWYILMSVPFSQVFPVPVALEIINRKFTEHINLTGIENILEHTYFLPKDKVISLLELVFNNP